MRRKTSFFALAMAFWLCLTSQALADTWQKAETDNFIVYSNSDTRTINAFATKLEQFRFILNQFYLSREEQANPAPKLEIYFLASRNEFRIIDPKIDSGVAGFVVTGCIEGLNAFSFDSGDHISTSETLRRPQENFSLSIIFHEYTHLFMAQNSAMVEPRWYQEGVAEYYSSMQFTSTEMQLGFGSLERLLELRDGGRLKYEDILRDAPSLRQSNFQDAFYAQSWLLTNYILHDTERERKLPLYFAARNSGEDPILAFERIFEVKVKDLPRILKRYLDTARVRGFKIQNMPVVSIKLETLPASANKLLLLDAAVKNCPSDEYEPQLLAKIKTEVAKFPNDVLAQDILARAEIIIGEEEKALEHYKAKTAQNNNDAEAFYRLGQVYYLMAIHDNIITGETMKSQIAKARTAFGRSYQLKPHNPSNLFYYSQTALEDANYPDESSLTAATEAFLMAPSNKTYSWNAIKMLIFKERFDDAKILLNSMANDPHASKISTNIGSAIAAIDAKKSRREVLDALLKTDEKPEQENN